MIYGLFLLDASGFSLLELFTKEFSSLKITKKEVFQALNSFTTEKQNYQVDRFEIDFVKVDEKHAIGLLLDEKLDSDNSLMNELIMISKGLIQGDKIMIHKIMGIRRSKEIEFLQH